MARLSAALAADLSVRRTHRGHRKLSQGHCMAQGTFWVREVGTTPEPASCVLIGQVRSGTVAPAMLLSVPLNSSISVTVRIKAVGYCDNTQELAL